MTRSKSSVLPSLFAPSGWLAIGVLLMFGVALPSYSDGASVSVSYGGISASAAVNATSMMVRVGGPGGYRDEQRGPGGYISWSPRGALADGTYHYDIYTTVGGGASDTQDGAGVRVLRESGTFQVQGGVVVPANAHEAKAPSSLGNAVKQALTALAEGMLNVIAAPAHAADVTVSSSIPTLYFNDTDDAGNDWTWAAYDAGTASASIILRDLKNPSIKNIFQVYSSTNNSNSFLVDQSGDISFANGAMFIDRSAPGLGIGTTTPTDPLHVMGFTFKVENAGSTWQWNNGGLGLWFLNTSSGTTPVKFNNSAPSNSLVVESTTGDVGMGTASPASPLHVVRATGAALNMLELTNNGPVGFNMTNTSIAQTWRFAAQTTGFRVSLDGTGGPEMEVGNGGTLQVGPGGLARLFLDALGNLTINGNLTQGSDRNNKTNINDLNGSVVLAKLTALPVSQWAYKGEPGVAHIGPMAQDFHQTFGLGADDKHIAPGDLASVAVMGVKELHKMVSERDAELAELKQKVAVLEALVNRLAAQGGMDRLAWNRNQ